MFIAQCLDSLYSQDIPEEDFEVICVNDCTPDNSASIVESYAEKHLNLKIINYKENRKLGGARNAGMEVATGNYIWFVDSDDFIEPNVLGTLCSIAEKDDLDILHFEYRNYPEHPVSHVVHENTGIMTGADLFFDKRFIWYHDLITAWRKIYKRDFLISNRIDFAEHIMFEDNDYSIKAFAYAERVKHIALIAYNYRNNPDSITRTSQSSEHIFYWINLSHRLCILKSNLSQDKKDIRFNSLIDGFIRYQMRNVIDVYLLLTGKERDRARIIIRKGINHPLKKYTPLKTYYRIKLGLI